MRGFLVGIVVVMTSRVALAQRWEDATAGCIGQTAEWTNKVELADLDGDGRLDILFANGGGYSSPGNAEQSRIWSGCTEVTQTILGGFAGRSRMIKAADVDGDGDLDVLTGGGYGTQLALFVHAASGWTDASAQLPQQLTSVGDAALGDVDGDGDLDVMLADWGSGDPSTNGGGRTRLYRNDGTGTFTDVTATAMPDVLVGWSWDLELADVDNDWDLDALVSCKACSGSYLLRNDGTGTFTEVAGALPQFGNNYDLSPADIDGDGDLDLATVNDGPSVTEHLFVNRGDGTFTDETSTRLTGTANPANVDDNQAVWLDVDDDGDLDLLYATLGSERLLLNDGGGVFTRDTTPPTPSDTPATLGIAVGDLDEDGRPDLVNAQGEVAFADRVQHATDLVARDTHAPRVRAATVSAFTYAYVDEPFVRVTVAGQPMRSLGGGLWRGPGSGEVCAVDHAGNDSCAPPVTPADDTPVPEMTSGGGCCDTRRDASGSLVLALAVLLVSARSRSTGRRSRSGGRCRR